MGKIILLAVILHAICKHLSLLSLIYLAVLLYSFEIIITVARFVRDLREHNDSEREIMAQEKSYWKSYVDHWKQFEHE